MFALYLYAILYVVDMLDAIRFLYMHARHIVTCLSPARLAAHDGHFNVASGEPKGLCQVRDVHTFRHKRLQRILYLSG